MTTTTETPAANPPREETKSEDRSHRITIVGWLAGITAVIAILNVGDNASVGTGLGVIGISGMVAFVSYTILKS